MSFADKLSCPGTRRGEARSNAILDAAIEVVAEVGYDRLTMDAVAQRAKASKATIYRHWPDKASLIVDAMRRRSCIDADLPDTGTLAGDLEGMVRQFLLAMSGTDGPLMVGLLAASAKDPELGALMRSQTHDDKQRAVEAVLRRARHRGELGDSVTPDLVLDVLPGALFMRLFVLGQPPDEPFVRRLVDDILIPLLTAPARQGA
ncbi:TetR/AcrR family transcriptional regulator [Acidiferrimicrobium sp. IK]|uniref:TetR/AcrR family transcriptional regulator n=1 Tax=Acidiferrimicrobium sp. IK TaxID=2871700 RepID=UPI0021CB8E1E|nr:TetR/AcrR family transcriptional regulator [Acidiferrimicrobium sp. IK]MCU4186825.1 TetR/AcrR family transcriptional regulator [Acidiferrimicrobium sp. IK]